MKSNSFLFDKIIKNKRTIFLYKENILPEKLLKNLKVWLDNKKFKDGYHINGNEIPRKQLWYEENGNYFCKDWKYRYERWESQDYESELRFIQNYIQDYVNNILDFKDIQIPKINSCLINKYRDGNDSIKPHNDTTASFGEYPTIVNLSIGGPREFVIHEKKKDNKFSINLKTNSLLIMAGGSQKFFQHEIPKNDSKLIRYSLTFREHLG